LALASPPAEEADDALGTGRRSGDDDDDEPPLRVFRTTGREGGALAWLLFRPCAAAAPVLDVLGPWSPGCWLRPLFASSDALQALRGRAL